MQRCNKIRQSGDAGAKQERAGSQAALQRRLAYARTRQATSAHNPLPAPATLRRYLRGRPQRRATTRKLGKLNSELRERERGEMPNKRAEVWGVTCPTPASVEHADIRVKSYNLNSRERYVCNSGFKRKAGTSSLTECVLNKTTNITHWTTPNLKCIRDPSLSHQRPVPPSTVVTAGVTPHPESPSPSGKEPATLSPTVTRETAVMPGSRLVPSKPPSPGTTGTGSHQLSQTTTKTLELTPSTSHKIPGVYSYSSRDATVAISSSVTLLCVLCVVSLLVCYIKSRRTPQPPNVEMEIMEATPMTGETSSPQEDPENYPHNL
ncbi:interleukin-15 receptor subunit alpha isoform X1 [Tupaia chinensis]|uniref:interleukin-15 receptor subunit alpha isoform X1 n=1 Tax=Tupaia chinensis TaxID=246437 RepID=UPI0007041C07|nr:interleukin-15 receptor subunit alpha isoform X1 [Tupaia chinensis]